MRRMGRRITILLLAGVLTLCAVGASSRPAYASSRFNDEYVFATTRDVSQMDAPDGLKLSLYPLTVLLDTAFLPFAVIAGFVT